MTRLDQNRVRSLANEWRSSSNQAIVGEIARKSVSTRLKAAVRAHSTEGAVLARDGRRTIRLLNASKEDKTAFMLRRWKDALDRGATIDADNILSALIRSVE